MSHFKIKSKECLNCGYKFTDTDNYCPQCGQENHNLNIPIKHFIVEALEGTIHFDTKSLRTFFTLLFKPGQLTLLYNQGKRVRYVPPLRLYIFISFVFFIAINFNPGKSQPNKSKSKLEYSVFSINSKDLEGLRESKIDSLLASKDITKGGFEEFLIRQLWKIANEGRKEFTHFWIKNISYMLFVLMPFFGWLVFIFHRKRKRFYYEYLIYSIHFHCFLFLILLIFILLAFIGINELVIGLFFIWIIFYLYNSIRNAFDQKWFSALLKSIILFILYFISVVEFFLMTIIISLTVF
jgi:hypothetical protein